MCLYKRHNCLKVKTICMLNGKPLLSVSLSLKTFNLSNSRSCVKQVGSWSTVNIIKVHAQSKTIQQSFSLSATEWDGSEWCFMLAYKTYDWDGHECLVRDNSLTRSPSALYSWCPRFRFLNHCQWTSVSWEDLFTRGPAGAIRANTWVTKRRSCLVVSQAW